MPRRSLLTSAERTSLLAFPSSNDDLIRYYTFSESDLSLINQHRGSHNRFGFAVQLCYLRYPGIPLPTHGKPPALMLAMIGRQLRIKPNVWGIYAIRAETRREHLAELQTLLGMSPFAHEDFKTCVHQLALVAQDTDRGIVLAETLIEHLRQHRIMLPAIDVIERICSEAQSRGLRQVYSILNKPLSNRHRRGLDDLLLIHENTSDSHLMWIRQPPGPPKPRHILAHLKRLKAVEAIGLPDGMEFLIHQNRLRKLAREGGQMTSQHLRDLEDDRRYATLVAVIFDSRATLIDEIIDLHDHCMASLFSKAKRTHSERFQQSGMAINDKVRLYSRIGRALVEAKASGSDPFAAIEAIIPWNIFKDSITEAERLAQPEEFDFLSLIGDGFNQFRRYTPIMLDTLAFRAAPAARALLKGVEVIRGMNRSVAKKVSVPVNAPMTFVRKRWSSLVRTKKGIDRRFYELCVLTELKNALRSGDIWVKGSRQFKDFDEYLLPETRFEVLREQKELGLVVDTDCDRFLKSRIELLESEMAITERLALADELPDASITSTGLTITPLDNAVPEEAEALMQKVSSLLPHVKITDLLVEVDSWTNFTHHFHHLKSEEPAKNQLLLLTAILADAINLGFSKMAESCPGTTYAKLMWLNAWYIRDETYTAALAELVNAQSRHPFATRWGDGTTSSSDGQNFKTGGRGRPGGQVNLKYGQEPGIQIYTHISDQYAPFHTKMITATVRDATYVLDGLLHHEADLRIEEHYTDTAGFTDHVFGLMHLLGFRFAPRIRDLADKRLYYCGDSARFPTLSSLLGGTINLTIIREHWQDLLRLASSLKIGTVSASLMLRKLGSYPRQNRLAVALRELGRIERTIYSLDWFQHVDLRRRVQVGLNKGEARNALARAVFMNRHGEIRDRNFDNQRNKASGLNLVVAAIVHWNTVYVDRAIQSIRDSGKKVDDTLLAHLSPLGWEHVSLTGDYVWPTGNGRGFRKYRPLRKPVDEG